MPGTYEALTSRMPFIASGNGIVSPFGVTLPPGGRVAAFVRSTGVQDYDESFVKENLVQDLATALGRCRSGRNDIVVVLEGHSESVTAATSTTFAAALLTGTKIIGVGQGSNRPTFTWTATTSTWAISVANVFISGCIFNFAGIDAVAKAINITGADVRISSCEIITTATSKGSIIGIEIGTGAHRNCIDHCYIRGLSSQEPGANGSVIKVAGAVNNTLIVGNTIIAPTRTTTAEYGHIRVSGIAIDTLIADNILVSTNAAALYCITLDAVASYGSLLRNAYYKQGAGVSTAGGVSFGGTTVWSSIESYCVDEASKSGLLTPVAGT